MQSLLFMAAIFGVMYFLFIMPEKKKAKKFKDLMSNLKIDDIVYTRGGIVGTIVALNDNIVTIATGPDNVKMDITRQGVGSVDSCIQNDEVELEEENEEEENKSTISLEKNSDENTENE